jgi:hypothetical protein
MAIKPYLAVDPGDLFQDLDPRHVGPRVVKVLAVWPFDAQVEVVEHWNEQLIGRRTWVSKLRLRDTKRYRKVSR